MPGMVTCKFDMNPIYNERASVETSFPPLYTEQKKKRCILSSIHFSLRTLLSDIIASYFCHLSDIRLANALVCFRSPSTAKEIPFRLKTP